MSERYKVNIEFELVAIPIAEPENLALMGFKDKLLDVINKQLNQKEENFNTGDVETKIIHWKSTVTRVGSPCKCCNHVVEEQVVL